MKNGLLSLLLFDIWLEILATAIQQIKEIRGTQIGKEEIELRSLKKFPKRNISPHQKQKKNKKKNSLPRINELSKVKRENIKREISITYQYTNNGHPELKLKIILFTVAPKK